MLEEIATVLVITVSFFLQSLFGFGGGLVSIPILSLIFEVQTAVTLVLIFQLLMGLLIVKTHQETEWDIVLPCMWGMILGVPLGVLTLGFLSDNLLRQVLAIAILLYVAKELFLKDRKPTGASTISAWIFGTLGGVVNGLIGSGGPLFVMYLSSVFEDTRKIRAGVIFLLASSNVLRISLSYFSGLLTTQIVTLAAIALIPFLIAIAAGQRFHTALNATYYRYCISVILLGSSASLLLKSLS